MSSSMLYYRKPIRFVLWYSLEGLTFFEVFYSSFYCEFIGMWCMVQILLNKPVSMTIQYHGNSELISWWRQRNSLTDNSILVMFRLILTLIIPSVGSIFRKLVYKLNFLTKNVFNMRLILFMIQFFASIKRISVVWRLGLTVNFQTNKFEST